MPKLALHAGGISGPRLDSGIPILGTANLGTQIR